MPEATSATATSASSATGSAGDRPPHARLAFVAQAPRDRGESRLAAQQSKSGSCSIQPRSPRGADRPIQHVERLFAPAEDGVGAGDAVGGRKFARAQRGPGGHRTAPARLPQPGRRHGPEVQRTNRNGSTAAGTIACSARRPPRAPLRLAQAEARWSAWRRLVLLRSGARPPRSTRRPAARRPAENRSRA
jgi:hypothetical protein